MPSGTILKTVQKSPIYIFVKKQYLLLRKKSSNSKDFVLPTTHIYRR